MTTFTNQSFPIKLFTILEKESPSIIRWIRDGVAFRVFDTRKFEDQILPKYYRHNKVESFQRQLNLYGFKRVSRGQDMGAYYHPLMLKGRKDLAQKIIKTPLLGNEAISPSVINSEKATHISPRSEISPQEQEQRTFDLYLHTCPVQSPPSETGSNMINAINFTQDKQLPDISDSDASLPLLRIPVILSYDMFDITPQVSSEEDWQIDFMSLFDLPSEFPACPTTPPTVL